MWRARRLKRVAYGGAIGKDPGTCRHDDSDGRREYGGHANRLAA